MFHYSVDHTFVKLHEKQGLDIEFGNGGGGYLHACMHAPRPTPTLIDDTHQCMVIM